MDNSQSTLRFSAGLMLFKKTTGGPERCDFYHAISLHCDHTAPIAKVTKTHVVDAIPSAATFLPVIIPTLRSGMSATSLSSSGTGVGLYVASAPTVAFSVVQAIGLFPERVVRKGQRVIAE